MHAQLCATPIVSTTCLLFYCAERWERSVELVERDGEGWND